MRVNAKIYFVLAAVVVVIATALLAVRIERGKTMHAGSKPVSGPVTISLPGFGEESLISVEKALRQRRSVREYGKEPLSMEDISRLLWAAQGITHGGVFRTSPSAGALYPLETYVVAGNVNNLPTGVYRYLPHGHELVQILSGDIRSRLCDAALRQDSINDAPASLVFSAVFARTTGKYGKRGIRYVHMEAGIAAQNAALQAVSLHLATVVIGAFDDDAVHLALSMPAGEEPMIIMPVGKERAVFPGR
jgi:SagB-type dehydrogenase family enzyme